MGFQGVDIRELDDRILFRASLKDSDGAKVTTGTTELRILKFVNDGTVETYDFNDNTFKTGACTDDEVTMTHRPINNAAVNTGVWTYALTTVTDFAAGDIILAQVTNTNAFPESQEREYQIGGGVISDVRFKTGNKYKIADTTGNWATTGTWSDGVVPAANQTAGIIVRDGVVVTVATAVDLGQYGTLELQGDGSINIIGAFTSPVVPRGWVIGMLSAATVTNNYGNILSSTSTVTNNYGYMRVAGGTLANNWYGGTALVLSLGTITTNYGKDVINYGTIGSNSAGTVINAGTVTTNGSAGIVFNAGGTVGTDNGVTYEYQTGDNFAQLPTNFSAIAISAGGIVSSDMTHIHGTALTETDGQLAAAFIKQYDVATPVFTAESVNQSADSYPIVSHITYGNSAILTQGNSAWITATGFNTTTPVGVDEIEDACNSALLALDLDNLMSDDGTRLADDAITNNVIAHDAITSGGLATTATEEIATKILDLAHAIAGKTLRQTFRYMAAKLAGKVTGAGTGTEKFFDFEDTERLRETIDDVGNRTAIEYDP